MCNTSIKIGVTYISDIIKSLCALYGSGTFVKREASIGRNSLSKMNFIGRFIKRLYY